MISFVCKVDEDDPSQFINASALLDHIRHILSICNSSREYFFELTSRTNIDAFGNVIASILEIPAIANSAHTYIALIFISEQAQWAREIISNWLNRERREIDQNERQQSLLLGCLIQYASIQEMCYSLKQVAYIYLSPNSFQYKKIHLKSWKNFKIDLKFFILLKLFGNLEICKGQIAFNLRKWLLRNLRTTASWSSYNRK